MVEWGALEKHCPPQADRRFESSLLRQEIKPVHPEGCKGFFSLEMGFEPRRGSFNSEASSSLLRQMNFTKKDCFLDFLYLTQCHLGKDLYPFLQHEERHYLNLLQCRLV